MRRLDLLGSKLVLDVVPNTKVSCCSGRPMRLWVEDRSAGLSVANCETHDGDGG